MSAVAERGLTVLLSSHVRRRAGRGLRSPDPGLAGRVQVAGDIEELVSAHRLLVGPSGTAPAGDLRRHRQQRDRAADHAARQGPRPDPRPPLDHAGTLLGGHGARLSPRSRRGPGPEAGGAVTWLAIRQHRIRMISMALVVVLWAGFVTVERLHPGIRGISASLFPYLPLVMGVFLGAPLLSREYERGTHQFAWTQSVTRSRWLAPGHHRRRARPGHDGPGHRPDLVVAQEAPPRADRRAPLHVGAVRGRPRHVLERRHPADHRRDGLGVLRGRRLPAHGRGAAQPGDPRVRLDLRYARRGGGRDHSRTRGRPLRGRVVVRHAPRSRLDVQPVQLPGESRGRSSSSSSWAIVEGPMIGLTPFASSQARTTWLRVAPRSSATCAERGELRVFPGWS